MNDGRLRAVGWLCAVTADGALRLTIQLAELADLTLDCGLADSAVRMALAWHWHGIGMRGQQRRSDAVSSSE